MENFGDKIRLLRERNNLPLRTVAAFLDIDQAILSKIERGHRNATREQVTELAKYFKVAQDDLLLTWLSDKLIYEIKEEELALRAIKIAEERIKFLSKRKKVNY